MTDTSRGVRYMLIFLWVLVPLLVASIVTWNLTDQQDISFVSNYFDSDYVEKPVHWPFYLIDLKKYQDIDGPSTRTQDAANIFFIASLQLLYTVALHLAEQFANLHRDEQAWRNSSRLDPKTVGALIGRNATRAAATAWPTVSLFIMKPVFHWIFGLSFPVRPSAAILYHPLPLFTLTVLVFLLASFATYLALRHPVGPQPSAYGNIERLVEMIDDWGKGSGSRIYWGNKSRQDDVPGERRVGTSANARDLTEVKIDGQPYLGMKGDQVRGEGIRRRSGWCF